ncbi:MAG: hypothetical protein ACFBSE_22105 [Prochloraceae cyanobacterium]
MVQSLTTDRATNRQEVFINELAGIKVYESRLLDCQCWQIYYKDLSIAAREIRKLIKN